MLQYQVEAAGGRVVELVMPCSKKALGSNPCLGFFWRFFWCMCGFSVGSLWVLWFPPSPETGLPVLMAEGVLGPVQLPVGQL